MGAKDVIDVPNGKAADEYGQTWGRSILAGHALVSRALTNGHHDPHLLQQLLRVDPAASIQRRTQLCFHHPHAAENNSCSQASIHDLVEDGIFGEMVPKLRKISPNYIMTMSQTWSDRHTVMNPATPKRHIPNTMEKYLEREYAKLAYIIKQVV